MYRFERLEKDISKRTYKDISLGPAVVHRFAGRMLAVQVARRARVAAIGQRIQDSSRMPISSTWLAWKSKRCNPFKRVSRWDVETWRKTSKGRKDLCLSPPSFWLSEGGIWFFFFFHKKLLPLSTLLSSI